MTTFSQDLRYGFRQYIKSPGFTLVAVLTLALSIGANTAIFSMINAVMLRSLPVPNPHELRAISWLGRNPLLNNVLCNGMGQTKTGMHYCASFPYPVYRDFRDQNEGFAEIFAYFPLSNATVLAHESSFTTEALMVSGNFFTGYGSRMQLGRSITPEDDQLGSEPVAVITHRIWERSFSLDPSVVGQTIQVNKKPFRIIGVLAPDFVGLRPGDPSDVYIPMSSQPQLLPNCPLDSNNHWWMEMMGRLNPGASEVQANASLDLLFRRRLNESTSKMDQPGILLEDGRSGPLIQRRNMSQPFWALLAVVGVVLLIACANLASLLLVRGVTRQHEMSIRSAIGAGRWRLIRQSLTESLFLSLTGATLGLIVAEWGKSLLLGFFGQFQDTLHFDTRTDTNVLWFTIGLSLLTTLLAGLIPALHASKVDPAAGLKDRKALRSPRLWMGKVLISTQIALSVLLVMGAGLLIQTFSNLRNLDPGFNPENILLFRLSAGQGGYDDQQRLEFYENVRQSITAIPGVQTVSLSDLALIGGGMAATGITIPDRPANSNERMQSNVLTVSDGFFSTMGIKLDLGRDFTQQDDKNSYRVAVVNETFARSFLPDRYPIGQHFQSGDQDYQIVGVCRDTQYMNLRETVPPTMYWALRQNPVGSMFFEVRSSLPPLSLVPAIRKSVAALDPAIPIENFETQRQTMDNSIFMEQLFSSLGSYLALLALLLSCIGLYGLMAYTVTDRTGEIGIRMALGARPCDVAFPIIREAILLSGIGIAIGIPIALGLSQLIRSVLFGVQPSDPTVMIGGIALMLGVAILSAWLPARRAARVDPMTALRCE